MATRRRDRVNKLGYDIGMINKKETVNYKDGHKQIFTKMNDYVDTIPGTNKKPEKTMKKLNKGPDLYDNIDYGKMSSFEVAAQTAKNKNKIEKFNDNTAKVKAAKTKAATKSTLDKQLKKLGVK